MSGATDCSKGGGLDDRLLPVLSRALFILHTPRWADRIGEEVDSYMGSAAWRDRFEQKLYLGLVVATIALL